MGGSLLQPTWLYDQSLKPDHTGGYYYTTPTMAIPFGYYQQNAGIDHANRSNWPQSLFENSK
jgi:hypothetical protein